MTLKKDSITDKPGFIERFLKEVSIHPDALAIDFEGDSPQNVTYAELLGLMENYKGVFEKLEVSENEMVMFILPSGAEFIASVYGIASAGGVALPVNSKLTHYEMDKILSDSTPVGIVTTSKIYKSYSRLFDTRSNFRFAISIKGDIEKNNEKISYYKLTDFEGVKSHIEPPAGNPVVTCHYTYRGCGYPLGVPHRYADYTTCVEGMGDRYPLSHDSPIIIGLPIYPIYGITIMVIFPLSFGCRLVIVSRFMEQNFVDVIERNRAVGACFVPIIIPKLISELEARGSLDKIDFNPRLLMSSSATSLPKALQDSIAEMSGIEILQGYGLTEGLAISTAYRGLESERGTLGVPIHDDITVTVVDNLGCEVAPGMLGEIVIGGPTVSEGFFNKPDENKKFFKNGYFYTGDLGYTDENGFLTFEGRALPIAKVAAQMVDLVELENVTLMHPDVIKAKATERKEPVGRNYVSLTVVVKKKSDLDQHKLQMFCLDYLSFFKVPAQIKFIKG